jgi:hypothetical protein
MNFGLSKNYSEIDFEDVSFTDLMLIGGGCGGGGGSTSVQSVQSVQAAAQAAAAVPGANASTTVTVSPTSGGNISLCWEYAPNNPGPPCSGPGAVVTSTTGQVNGSSGGFWSSVGSFFCWLFGSH